MKPRFYDNGLQFECTGCGECCKYSDAVVYVTDEEITAIAGYLQLSDAEFALNYIGAFRGEWVLKSRGDACIFLNDHVCKVYPVRPRQCQTFPFWSDILKTRERWNLVSESCEGMDQGRLFNAEEIHTILKTHQSVPGVTTRKE